jgi:NTP pyrophosphatase (non-canonical NTP hydrolase)
VGVPENNLLAALAKQCLADSKRYFPEVNARPFLDLLQHHALGLVTESGEFGDIVKKIWRGSLDFNALVVQDDLKNELADVLVYLLNLFAMLEIDPLDAYARKREFNNRRFLRGQGSNGASGGDVQRRV